MKSSALDAHRTTTEWKRLPLYDQQWIEQITAGGAFSSQQIKRLIDMAADLDAWQEGSLESLWNGQPLPENRQASKKSLALLEARWERLKKSPKSYKNFSPRREEPASPSRIVESTTPGNILGRCPVASPRTRCCNLMTLDAVTGCTFDCTYCSIQTFYTGGQIRFEKNLADRLRQIEEEVLDPEKGYHIGTGQSSDSLLWGNRNGLLDDLCAFAERNPKVVLELKTKSSRIEYLLENPVPPNVLVTWSLNTPDIARFEERKTPTPDERIEAARKVADRGILVGFHFHPIVDYREGEEEYAGIYQKLIEGFDADEVALTSFGTLTYIKPVIRKLRRRGMSSKILQMPLEDAEGKFSYPLDTKLRLFSHAYQSFRPWHKKVFFYLCMEDQTLWEPVFGRSYPSNEDFEQDMIHTYLAKIEQHKRSRKG